MKINQVQDITMHSKWERTRNHRAVPAISATKDGLLLIVYREGSDHVDMADGCIKILRSEDDGHNWQENELIPKNWVYDIRVNHGMAQIDGVVYLPYQEVIVEKGTGLCRTVVTTTKNGYEWKELFRDKEEYLFFPYGRLFQYVKHYAEHDETELCIPGYFIIEKPMVSTATIRRLRYEDGAIKGNKWFNIASQRLTDFSLNETDICQYEDDEYIAVSRDERNDYAQITRTDNLEEWGSPIQLPFAIHSPCLLKVGNRLLLAGREWNIYKNKFDLKKAKCLGTTIRESLDRGYTWSEPLLLQKSYSWDCGYPSAIEKNGVVYIVFYSEFVRGNSDIMLAILEV